MASIPGFSSSKGRKPNWEELRKEARQLESQVDSKLVQLNKLGTSLNSSSSISSGFGRDGGEKEPLMAGDSDDDSSTRSAVHAKDLSNEIYGLLSRLSCVNDGLQDWTLNEGADGAPPSAAVHHTLQRHKDILHDYQQEFNKTRSNVMAAIERYDLLDSVHKDINDYKNASSSSSGVGGGGGSHAEGNRRMAILMKESEHARNSERMMDEHISIAVEARESLVNQRVAFKAIQTKLNDISNKFPIIKNLIQKVNLRKSRDTIILGAVIGSCILFLLWYAFG